MVISTNLSVQDFQSTYSERIVSRIIGNFEACKFVGDDIRLKIKGIL
jgi:DNA replication protein DnaC